MKNRDILSGNTASHNKRSQVLQNNYAGLYRESLHYLIALFDLNVLKNKFAQTSQPWLSGKYCIFKGFEGWFREI